MSAYTKPTPWRAIQRAPYMDERHDEQRLWSVINANGTPLAHMTIYSASADAQLMAAAPELLSAVAMLAEDLEDGHWQHTKEYLRELVAKATGGAA